MKLTMNLIGFDDFIHCRHLNMLFFFFKNEGYRSVRGIFIATTLFVVILFTFVADWAPFWVVHKFLEKKTKLSGILLQFKVN